MTGKRRRLTWRSVAPSSWELLPADLVAEIAWRVLAGDLLDYIRLRAVCTRWRSATASPGGRGVVDPRFHPRRWMMLPEGHGLYPGHHKLRGYIRFFNLRTGAFIRARLPHFRDHCVLDSVDGLLLLQRDHDTAIRLLHPFTGDIAELPPLATLLAHPGVLGRSPVVKWHYIRSVRASVSITAAGVTTVMLIFCELGKLAFATSQDQQWTMSSQEFPYGFPISFQGKLYWMDYTTYRIFQIDPPVQEQDVVPKSIATLPVSTILDPGLAYLVECNSEILVVCDAGDSSLSSSHIIIYRLADLILERFVAVTSIGDNALIINQRSLCVSSKTLPNVKGDTVVYFDGGLDYDVQYNLCSGKSSKAIDECSQSGFYPGPCSLIIHLASCCVPRLWNKGLIGSDKEFRKKGGCSSWMVKGKFRIGA